MSLIQKVKIGDRVLVETASYIMPPDSQIIEFTLTDNKRITLRFTDDKEKKKSATRLVQLQMVKAII